MRGHGLEHQALLGNHDRDAPDVERPIVAVADAHAQHPRPPRGLQPQALPRLSLFRVAVHAGRPGQRRPGERSQALARARRERLPSPLDENAAEEPGVRHVEDHRAERLIAGAEVEDEARLAVGRVLGPRRPGRERELPRLAPLLRAHPGVQDLQPGRVVGTVEHRDLQELMVVLGQPHGLVTRGVRLRHREHVRAVGERRPLPLVLVPALDLHPAPEVVAGQRQHQLALEHGLPQVERDGGALAAQEAAVERHRLAEGRLGLACDAVEHVGDRRPRLVDDAQVAQVRSRPLVDLAVQGEDHLAGPPRLDVALERGGAGRGRDQDPRRQHRGRLQGGPGPPHGPASRGCSRARKRRFR